MNLYKCYIEEHTWGQVDYTHVEYIWAQDEFEARDVYCKQHRFRKNKKGLIVIGIPIKITQRVMKLEQEYVTHRQLQFLGGYEYRALETVPHYYCGNCGKELSSQDRWCTRCDSTIQ